MRDKIKALPLSPGCYIFKNIHGTVIYVGKSKALKNRVHQYFQGLDKKDDKLKRLAAEIADMDYIITENETEALILEHKLIQKYWPKYNSAMKSHRRYPFLRIDLQAESPGLSVATAIEPDGAEYFGCFRNINSVETAIELISSVWKTPICGKASFCGLNTAKHRPCLRHHIDRCTAPCAGHSPAYKQSVEEIVRFLKGNSGLVFRRLRREMKGAAADLRFEEAAAIKSKIQALESLEAKTRRFNTALDGKIFILLIRAFNEQGFSIYYIENGAVLIHRRSNELNTALTQDFTNAVTTSQHNVSDEALAKSLTEISADKLYIEIKPKNKKPKQMLELITKSIDDFLKE